MENEVVTITHEQELIAQAMRETRGDLAKASRYDAVPYNAMALRAIVKDNPAIRRRYHELLAEEMQEKGLHIAERILKMAELQEQSFGGMMKQTDPATGEVFEVEIPPDPRVAIDLSKEISRLIAEGRNMSMSEKSAVTLTSKEDVKELLERYLAS